MAARGTGHARCASMPPSAAEAQAALAKKREARAKRAAGSKPTSGSKAEPTPHRQLVDALRQLEKECGRDEEGKARLASALGLLLFVTDTLIDANAKKDTTSGRLIRVDDSFNMRLGRLDAHKPCMEALGFSLVAQRGRKMYVAGKTAASLRRLKDVDVSKEGFLLPIVSEALRAPLPEDWAECEDAATGEFYYRNRRTEQTMWEHPLEQHFKDRLLRERQQYEQERSGTEAELEKSSTSAQRDSGLRT